MTLTLKTVNQFLYMTLPPHHDNTPPYQVLLSNSGDIVWTQSDHTDRTTDWETDGVIDSNIHPSPSKNSGCITKVVLKEGWSLVKRSFTWKYEGKGFRESVCKTEVASHQDSFSSGVLLKYHFTGPTFHLIYRNELCRWVPKYPLYKFLFT